MITVILCSYHGEKYLDAQRRSILSQKTEVPFELREYDDEIRHSGSATNNFLSAIREAPDSDYYMLSDQDDLWHRDKIDKMYKRIREIENACCADDSDLTALDVADVVPRGDAEMTDVVLRGNAVRCSIPVLVFSDACVVDDKLNVIADSFVRYERLTPTRISLPQLLIMNQVTGAACIFNHALKKLLEEHPMPEHAVVHDQWLALIVSALGKIEYLDEALYDYRQHGANVLGAKKGDAVREGMAMAEAGHGDASRAAYDALSAQAEEFLGQYRDLLSPDQIDVLWHFAQLPKLSKAERVRTVMKYGFTYNRLYRTLGELVNI